MAQALMIDLETLSTTPACVILTIGVAVFDPRTTGIIDTLELRPSIDDQLTLGREISDDTVRWWGNQSDAAQHEALGDHDRIPFKDAMEQLHKFCWNKGNPWSHGAAFDIVAIETAWRSLGMSEPWQFHKVRDTRTLFDITKVNLKDGGYVTTHRAIDDAINQAKCVQRAYQILNKVGMAL